MNGRGTEGTTPHEADLRRGDRTGPSFLDPARVALEELQSVDGQRVVRLKRTKSSRSVQVFEWERDRQLTTVVVARPYWLSRVANGTRVAWVPTLMEAASCETGNRR